LRIICIIDICTLWGVYLLMATDCLNCCRHPQFTSQVILSSTRTVHESRTPNGRDIYGIELAIHLIHCSLPMQHYSDISTTLRNDSRTEDDREERARRVRSTALSKAVSSIPTCGYVDRRDKIDHHVKECE